MKDRLIELFGEEWYLKLEPFFSNHLPKINYFINNERNSGKIIYPLKGDNDSFKCYKLTQPKDVKVVIIASHYEYDGLYDGLALSGSKLIEESPVLKIILREVEKQYPDNYTNLLSGLDLMDLSRWSKQGVMLLNRELTYEKGKPLSHLSLWNPLIVETIKVLNDNPYTLWVLIGESNWCMEQHITVLHRKIKTVDPVNNPDKFAENRLFISINDYLSAVNKKDIIW